MDVVLEQQIIWQVLKWLYVAAFLVYAVFGVIVWQQVNLMAKTLDGILNLPIRLLGIVVMIIGLLGLASALIVL